MISKRLLNQPLSILRRTASPRGRYREEVATFAAPVAVQGYLTPQTSTEQINGRDTVVTVRRCYLGAEVEIGPLDRVVSGTSTYEVDGEPERFYNPRTQEMSHIVVTLVTTQGG